MFWIHRWASRQAGIHVTLERQELDAWLICTSSVTDADGRCAEMLPTAGVLAGRYRLTFTIAEYFPETLYPEVTITFEAAHDGASYHLPLLLNPFGYTTYRGS